MTALSPTLLPANKHQQKTEATRRKLLRAARRVFARDGFEAARIEDIAVEAGYSRGAFYAQFQTKEDLFFSLLEDESHRHMEEIRALLNQCRSDPERFEALRNYYATRKSDRQWSILILEFKLYASRHPRIRARLARMQRSIRDRMKWEDLKGCWPAKLRDPSKSSELTRTILSAVLHALVLERAYDPSSISEEQLESSLRDIFDFLLA